MPVEGVVGRLFWQSSGVLSRVWMTRVGCELLLTTEGGVRTYFADVPADFPTLHPRSSSPSPQESPLEFILFAL